MVLLVDPPVDFYIEAVRALGERKIARVIVRWTRQRRVRVKYAVSRSRGVNPFQDGERDRINAAERNLIVRARCTLMPRARSIAISCGRVIDLTATTRKGRAQVDIALCIWRVVTRIRNGES